MKILFDHQIFFLQKYGGISNYFFNLIKALNKKKIRNRIYAPLYINRYINELKSKNIFGININLNFLKINFILNNVFFKQYLKYYKPDIVHLTYYDNVYLADKTKKYILTVYDMIHEEYSKNFKKDKTSIKKFKLCNEVDHIIAISKNTKKKLIKFFGIKSKKISVVYLGGNHLKKIKPLKIDIKKKFILYVGSRAGYKNFENLIKAYYLNNKIKKDYDLVVFGGEKIRDHELNRYKKKFSNIDNVHFIQSNDRVLKYLFMKASLFVYPSMEEGFGIPPLEAINSNCPVVCSNIPVLKEVLGNCCYYFEPNNVKNINLTIKKVLYSSHIHEKIFKSSHKIKKKFTWEKCALKTINVYKKVLRTVN
tara:strand:- start:35 stop:1129 length:1095 start_codon:yes stop_codon:yes gene_type:complete